MDAPSFKAFCKRYLTNALSPHADQLLATLQTEHGSITLAGTQHTGLDDLLTGLKYSKPLTKSKLGTAASLLPSPPLSKPLQRLSFRLLQRYHSLPLAFRLFDKDQDGLISLPDFQTAVNDLNLGLNSLEIEGIFQELGGKTGLSFDDFVKLKGDPVFPQRERKVEVRKSQGSESPSRLYFGVGRHSPRTLPSDLNPDHSYGLKNRYSDDISALLHNTFEREYLDKLKQRQDFYRKREQTQLRLSTNSERLRNEAIRRKLEGKSEKKEWKMSKFVRKRKERREEGSVDLG